ncbi:unnamed protein product [Penicillium olsonii]|nr:unnamed protein product [Penicillium olsonii]
MKNGDAILSPVSIVHRGYLLDVDTDEPLPADEVVDQSPVSMVFRAKSYEWKSTSVCRKLKTILSASAHNHDINKVIGFGLGGFSRRMIPYKSATRAMTQHVLLRVLKDWLQKKTGGKSPCYAQDPAYNSTDTQVLQENGIEVIDDPCGWLEVDEQSMVVSIAATVPVKEIIADIARPAVIIWDRVSFEDAIGMTGESARLDPNSYRVFKMMEEYDMFEFGAGEDLCPWGSIVVYIRKSKTAVPPNFK